MKYPATVIVVAVIVTIILMVKVVPVFEELFSSFGADLPAFTKMVVNMSQWMQKYWFILIIVIGVIIAGFLETKKRSKKFTAFVILKNLFEVKLQREYHLSRSNVNRGVRSLIKSRVKSYIFEYIIIGNIQHFQF